MLPLFVKRQKITKFGGSLHLARIVRFKLDAFPVFSLTLYLASFCLRFWSLWLPSETTLKCQEATEEQKCKYSKAKPVFWLFRCKSLVRRSWRVRISTGKRSSIWKKAAFRPNLWGSRSLALAFKSFHHAEQILVQQIEKSLYTGEKIRAGGSAVKLWKWDNWTNARPQLKLAKLSLRYNFPTTWSQNLTWLQSKLWLNSLNIEGG